MKRALAERAKRAASSSVPVPVHSATNVNAGSAAETGMPPKKIPRTADKGSSSSSSANTNASVTPAVRKKNQSASGTSGSGSASTSTSTSTSASASSNAKKNPNKVTSSSLPQSMPVTSSSSSSTKATSSAAPSSSHKSKSKKRIRPPYNPSTPPPPEPDDSDQSAFYLRHQNKALASELYQFKFMIGLLENEREKRRVECREIGKSVKELEGVWRGVERVITDSLADMVNDGAIGSSSRMVHGSLPQDVPASTGSGQNIEVTMSIIDSITNLANSPFSGSASISDTKKEDADVDMNDGDGDGDGDHDENCENGEYDNESEERESKREISYLNQLSQSTANFSNRCSKFQQLLLKLIKNTSASQAGGDGYTKKEMVQVANFESQISKLRRNCTELELQVKELAKARDEANISERRVRRGLYRVASGRLKIGEVLKAVEKDGASSLGDIEQLQNDILAASTPASQTVKKEENGKDNGQASHGTADAIMLDGKVINSTDVMTMKKKIDDLGLINDSREKRITELTEEKLKQDKQINNLMAQDKEKGTLQDKDIEASPIFVEVSHKLASAEKEVEGLKKDLQYVKDRWAQSKGDLELAKKTIDELEKNHNTRLRELSGGESDVVAASGECNGGKAHVKQAKLVMELEHKLKHALDTVRQSESVRVSLTDAHSMNEILQRQIGELKAKNVQLKAQSQDGNAADSPDAPSKDGTHSKDKIYKMKKELSELKHKYEQVEKGRDSLITMNTRLQQQSVEKDDMNAKSLSTILHLKQLSEQLEQEKIILEKNLKSAQQLALAARLAAHAKSKVEEKAIQEKTASENEAKKLRLTLESLQKEKEKSDGQLAIVQTQLDSSKSEMGEIRQRCDELVAVSAENEQSRQKLEEALVVAKKDALEAVQKAAAAQAQSKGSCSKFETTFTAEELTIQVNSLKSRLACPVCATREKKVIITRCRHMFCRNCVAANLEGRNRKCPSCGIRFDKKDVEDVWF